MTRCTVFVLAYEAKSPIRFLQVLAEEAEEFVIKIYRMLNFELLSALHGVKL